MLSKAPVPKLAVLFRRFGPYHHARLNAAGKLLELFGVEACGIEDTYAWERVPGAESFTRITLTDRQANNREWKQRLDREMRRTLNAIQPQVVAVPGWSSTEAVSALCWCLQNRRPAIVMSDSTERDMARTTWREAIKKRVVGLFSTALVAGTPHRQYLARLGMPPERVFLGYDAVDNAYFAENANAVRRESPVAGSKHGLPENYFLASARFVEKKNLSRLIDAYARYRALARKSGDGLWSLVLLGDGPLRPALNSQLSTLNLHDHVLLPGFKQYNELPVYYGLASTFVLASTSEPWGLVVNEAMASGLPVLVSNRCGCAADLVQDGVNGYTFDPYNIEQLAHLMFKLAALNSETGCGHSGALCPQLSTFGNASTRIISDWGSERFAAALKAAMDKAIEVGPKRAMWLDQLLLSALLFR
jgi:glycosyltransferase involved in cell wall biosynthesis